MDLDAIPFRDLLLVIVHGLNGSEATTLIDINACRVEQLRLGRKEDRLQALRHRESCGGRLPVRLIGRRNTDATWTPSTYARMP